MIRDEEIQPFRERWPLFLKASQLAEWPEALEQLMRKEIGQDWFAYVLAAIDSRESNFGLLLDEEGKGDHGFGHGEMQVDSRSHASFISTGGWMDLWESLTYVINNVIMTSYNYLSERFDMFGFDHASLFWAAIAAYNCGPGNVVKAMGETGAWDSRTTGRDYSNDVRNRAIELVGRET